jgi:hypothetical protein
VITCQPTGDNIHSCHNCHERRNTYEGNHTKLFEVRIGDLIVGMVLCASCLKELAGAIFPHRA